MSKASKTRSGYWRVHYQAGRKRGSFTCDDVQGAVALAQSLQKARHFKRATVVHWPLGCRSMWDAVIVMEIGSDDLIPCRPHSGKE